jgi:hypothetical protein
MNLRRPIPPSPHPVTENVPPIIGILPAIPELLARDEKIGLFSVPKKLQSGQQLILEVGTRANSDWPSNRPDGGRVHRIRMNGERLGERKTFPSSRKYTRGKVGAKRKVA